MDAGLRRHDGFHFRRRRGISNIIFATNRKLGVDLTANPTHPGSTIG